MISLETVASLQQYGNKSAPGMRIVSSIYSRFLSFLFVHYRLSFKEYNELSQDQKDDFRKEFGLFWSCRYRIGRRKLKAMREYRNRVLMVAISNGTISHKTAGTLPDRYGISDYRQRKVLMRVAREAVSIITKVG